MLNKLWLIFCSPKDGISDLKQISSTPSAVEIDPFDDDGELSRYDISMTEFGKEAISDSDESFSDSEGYEKVYFTNPHYKELVSLDEVVQKARSSTSIMRTSRLSLPIEEEEMSQEPLPTNTSNLDLNKSPPQLERKLDPSAPPSHEWEYNKHKDVQKQKRSSSLPQTHNATKPSMNGTEMYHGDSTTCKMEHQKRRKTIDLDISAGARRPSFQSEFLNDNELHTIWKPDTPNITAASEPIQKRPSISVMLPENDPRLPSSNQRKRSATSLENEASSPTGVSRDLWLRQKQLQERVNVAREVAKAQNVTLAKPEVSQDKKRHVLQLAPKMVSYHISKKPKHLDDVILQAMRGAADSRKSLLTDSDRPLTSKEKWQKAILLSANKKEAKRRPSAMTSLASSDPEMQPVNIPKGQRMKEINENPFLGLVPQSQSDGAFSASSNNLKPNKRPNQIVMNTKPLSEDIVEINENELNKEILVTKTDDVSTIETTTNSASTMTSDKNKMQVNDKEAAANSGRY